MRTLLRLAAATAAMAALHWVPRTVEACGWDYETYHAEAKSMPCVFDALLGFWPKHADAYHERRIEAFSYALAWAPEWTEGLDAVGISKMKLGHLDDAEVVMNRRLEIAPDAYPSHANLGTLYTFTGAFDRALSHIDRAMAIDSDAHFGREKYHRALVVFLQRVAADASVAQQENFLGFAPSKKQRLQGSRATYATLGQEDAAIDALVAMITVYGADELAEVYLTLGELLAVRGHKRLAYTAYRRAVELGHPRASRARTWQRDLDAALRQEHDVGSPRRERFLYRGIGHKFAIERRAAKTFQEKFVAWERKRIAEGLPVWTREGLDEIYAHMQKIRPRCAVPKLIADVPADKEVSEATETSTETAESAEAAADGAPADVEANRP